MERLLSQGQTFVVQLGYQNQDTDWAKAQISAAGGKESMDKEVYNKVWSDAKLTTKDFKNGPGSYRLQTVGRSGKLIDAKLTLAKFIPSEQADSTVLGPFTK